MVRHPPHHGETARSDTCHCTIVVMSKDARSKAKPALGVAGAIAAIVSIWWFALRPRRQRGATPSE